MDPALATVLVASIAAGASVICAWIVNKTHKLVNSRMDELLMLTKKSSKAEGKLEEATEELNRRL